ncbi:hypothetical protein TIFTF001_032871 [Ficus carica]|uniref:RNase H type-1 domain-containing protein n=1 Tax=Ficus carica TaxID=3494 RepID=A0AA88DZC5_FICCA|nr:hypothetical protein TIFTF001_032871 [Ficus carica]
MAKACGLNVNVVESDAVNVVQAINTSSSLEVAGPIIDDIKASLCQVVGDIACRHVARSGNVVAHKLANLAFLFSEEVFGLNVVLRSTGFAVFVDLTN